jgi:3-phosphoshikimate 1-carboxyvinyltransferase
MDKNKALVSFPEGSTIDTTIRLTGSKSESNRALIIAALSKGLISVDNLSDAADTVILNGILQRLSKDPSSALPVDVGHAGTAMRFLTAYLSTVSGSFELTGSKRMKERPIKLLVEALWTLGASISYLEENGYPPLQITGGFKQLTDAVQIKGDVSSQYLSALLIIASTLEKGLTLQIVDDLTSEPYVKMTLKMLEEAGIQHIWNHNVIKIGHQQFTSATLVVEPDWSAASYWYSIAALLPGASISLPNLKDNSLQGDSQIQHLMVALGVTTNRTENGISISSIAGARLADSKVESNLLAEVVDLKNCPDLAQTIIVCAAAKGLDLKFTGLETLKIKETNRVKALQNELAKIGVELIEDNLIYTLNTSGLHFPEKVVINTYDDHRMAMAFAPLSLLIKELEIEDMNVVEKSYPDFWRDLEKAGFMVHTIK